MVSARIFAGLAALAVTATAMPVVEESPIPGYTIEVIEWEAQASPDSAPIHVSGTVEDVIAELAKTNPNIEADVEAAAAAATASETSPALTKRYTIESSFCNGRWSTGRSSDLEVGIRNLRGVSGRPQRGPGPGSCGRVSCTDHTAIYWCNDNTSLKYLDSFSDIANGAQHINDKCKSRINAGGYWDYEVAGQVFYTDKWNVIVRLDNC